MDGTLAIEANRAALKRIVAGLVDMAGFADGPHPEVPAKGGPRTTIPRILWRAILKILRPAESAARRLIIAAAHGLVVPPPVRKTEPKPAPLEPLLRRFGIAVTMAPADLSAILPRSRISGTMRSMGEGAPSAPKNLSLPLFDAPRHLGPSRARFVPAHAAPRICVPGVTEPAPLPPRPSPGDRVGAEGLTRRLAALIAALEDLPGQARRYVRLSARRRAGPAPSRLPIRRTRPPGGRLARYDPAAAPVGNIREIDEILAHAHALALHALDRPDTS